MQGRAAAVGGSEQQQPASGWVQSQAERTVAAGEVGDQRPGGGGPRQQRIERPVKLGVIIADSLTAALGSPRPVFLGAGITVVVTAAAGWRAGLRRAGPAEPSR